MSISDFLAKAKATAERFRGDPAKFFKQLRAGNPVATCLLEREYQRFVNGEATKAKTRPIFELLTPSETTAAIMAKAQVDPEGALAAAMAHAESVMAKADAALSAIAAKKQESVTPASNRLEQLGKEVATLATHPSPKVSGPIQKGIQQALGAQEKLDAKLLGIRQMRTPHEKLQALRDLKSAELAEANAAHQARCAKTRDEIVARSRAPFTKK